EHEAHQRSPAPAELVGPRESPDGSERGFCRGHRSPLTTANHLRLTRGNVMPPLTVRMEEAYGPPATRCMPRRLERVDGGTPCHPSGALLAILASAMAVLSHASALASCDAIPGRSGAFRGALGVLDRPFARPGDAITLER